MGTNKKPSETLAVLSSCDVVRLLTELTDEAGFNALGLEINTARAAVAELIEAVKVICGDNGYGCHWTDSAVRERIFTALARVGGWQVKQWITCPDCNGQGGHDFQKRGYCASHPDAWGWSECDLCMGTGEVFGEPEWEGEE